MKQSAGLLMYRTINDIIEVFLVHPGGPLGLKGWSIPKGQFSIEAPIDAAKREFHEETGIEIPVNTEFFKLTPVQAPGKMIYSWFFKDVNNSNFISSNHFDLEWPPKSGTYISVPENDRGEWYTIEQSLELVFKSQRAIIQEFSEKIMSARWKS